jgi:hypothetical protein
LALASTWLGGLALDVGSRLSGCACDTFGMVCVVPFRCRQSRHHPSRHQQNSTRSHVFVCGNLMSTWVSGCSKRPQTTQRTATGPPQGHRASPAMSLFFVPVSGLEEYSRGNLSSRPPQRDIPKTPLRTAHSHRYLLTSVDFCQSSAYILRAPGTATKT